LAGAHRGRRPAQGDHRAPHCLLARLAGARRLEHGRAAARE
jgi:hypothetical protein